MSTVCKVYLQRHAYAAETLGEITRRNPHKADEETRGSLLSGWSRCRDAPSDDEVRCVGGKRRLCSGFVLEFGSWAELSEIKTPLRSEIRPDLILGNSNS